MTNVEALSLKDSLPTKPEPEQMSDQQLEKYISELNMVLTLALNEKIKREGRKMVLDKEHPEAA